MPVNVVKTKRDERLWAEAKAAVRKEYPDIAEGEDRFYKLVMGIYKGMRGKRLKKAIRKGHHIHCTAPDETGFVFEEMGAFQKSAREDSAFIGLPLPPSACKQLKGKYCLDKGQYLHMTVLFIPEGVKTAEDRAKIKAAVKGVAQQVAPIRCKFTGRGIVGKDQDVFAALATVENGAEFHTLLTFGVASLWRTFPRDFDFLPHVTLTPPEYKDNKVQLPEVPQVKWVSRECILSFGNGEKHTFKLQGAPRKLKVRMAKGGLGRMGGDALGLGGSCVCPDCGKTVKHKRGKPCDKRKCPSCGATMQRKGAEKSLASLLKAATQRVRVKAHTAKTKSGKVTPVAAHTATRKRAEPKKKTTRGKRGKKSESVVQAADQAFDIPLTQVRPDPAQHRKKFDKRKTQELADSIVQSGQKTPIVVRRIESTGKAKFQIIAGERRYRASKLIGKKTITAVIRENVTDEDALIEQVIENISRENVTPTEEATAYRQLADGEIARAKRRKAWQGKDYNSPENIQKLELIGRKYAATKSGKERSRIDYYIVLADLPEEAREMVDRGSLTTAHAHALIRLTDPAEDSRLWTDRKLRKRREQHLVRMARYARANNKITAQILNGMVTEYIRSQQQSTMFSKEEATGGEKQVRRQEQKSKLSRVLEAVVNAINTAWSDEEQEFKADAMTGTDLQNALTQIDGAQESFTKLREVIEREMFEREAVEATKRRVNRAAATEPGTGGGPRGGSSNPTHSQYATTSLFQSISAMFARRAA